jgi:hypothetical protein
MKTRSIKEANVELYTFKQWIGSITVKVLEMESLLEHIKISSGIWHMAIGTEKGGKIKSCSHSPRILYKTSIYASYLSIHPSTHLLLSLSLWSCHWTLLCFLSH